MFMKTIPLNILYCNFETPFLRKVTPLFLLKLNKTAATITVTATEAKLILLTPRTDMFFTAIPFPSF